MDQAFKGISINYEKNAIPSLPEIRYTGSDIRVRDDSMNCAQVALAVEAPGYSDPNFVAFEIASSVSFFNLKLTLRILLLYSLWAAGILPREAE